MARCSTGGLLLAGSVASRKVACFGTVRAVRVWQVALFPKVEGLSRRGWGGCYSYFRICYLPRFCVRVCICALACICRGEVFTVALS